MQVSDALGPSTSHYGRGRRSHRAMERGTHAPVLLAPGDEACIRRERARVPHHHDRPPRPREGHVQAAIVGDEAQVALLVRPHGRDEDHVLFAALVRVHGVDLDVAREGVADEARLRRVGRDDADVALGDRREQLADDLD